MEIKNLNDQLAHIDSRIAELSRELKMLPAGSLEISSSKGCPKYRLYHKGHRRYLSKHDPLLLHLARKKCIQLELRNLMQLRKATDLYVRHFKPQNNDLMEYLSRHQELASLIKQNVASTSSLAVWVLGETPSAQKHAPFREGKIHKMRSGHVVRSKAETMIDSALLAEKIPFRYEDPLDLNGRTVYPDFTIRHPITGQYYYWEHFGMMDDADYIIKTTRKISQYAHGGIVPGRDLIMTFETSRKPLLNEEIFRMIDLFFR